MKNYLSAQKLLSILLNSDAENIKTIANTWKELIIQHINGDDESKSIIACIMGIDTNNLITFSNSLGKIVSEERKSFWYSVSKFIFYKYIDRIKELSLKNYEICVFCFEKKEVSIINLVKWHGLNSIFELCGRVMLPGLSSLPIAEIIFDNGFSSLQSSKNDCSRNELDELGQFLTSSLTQITGLKIKIKGMIISTLLSKVISYDCENTEQLTTHALFAAFYIVAVFLEITTLYLSEPEITKQIIEFFKAKQFPIFHYTFFSRFEPRVTNKMLKELEKSNLTIEQQNFMQQWGQGKINLIDVVEGI